MRTQNLKDFMNLEQAWLLLKADPKALVNEKHLSQQIFVIIMLIQSTLKAERNCRKGYHTLSGWSFRIKQC